jgi:carboxypeptidase Taq
VHWYDGAFGYFPHYTLGAMAAAQLMQVARRALPDLDAALALGDIAPLREWMRARVHAHGSLFGFSELLRQATGQPFDGAAFETYIVSRYLS